MKYRFTPEMDSRIRDVYRKNDGKRSERAVPLVRELAASFGMPRWRVTNRAREIGAYEPRVKEPVWSEAEIDLLHENFHKHPEVIRKIFKKHGFVRSVTGIIVKRRRLGLLQSFRASEGLYTSRALAQCLGIDDHSVTGWIKKGWLKAKRRGTDRTPQQGGDMYEITEKDVREFIVENVGVIDIRKVDKFWFVDLVAGRFIKRCED
jgi:hypothetical protein